jgi:hypothetical protein
MGDLSRLEEYEWRNQTEASRGTLPTMTSAAWNGMTIPNGRLLMVGDQSWRHHQFARYIPTVAEALCQELILGCGAGSPRSRNPPRREAVRIAGPMCPTAIVARLSSVPGLLHTTLDDTG